MRTAILASLAAALLLPACGTGPDEDEAAERTTLTVSKGADDGSEGTLRWAILKSNAEPGKFDILLTPPAGGLVIAPTAPLPAIVGPTRIAGPWTGNSTDTPTVALDGSQVTTATACSGPDVRSLAGFGLQVMDSRDVEITGFEVRNFCTGILSLRSHDNFIHAMRLAGNLGAAAIVITGDNGLGASSGNSTNNVLERNVFVNNTDGLDISLGASGTIVRTNTFTIEAGRAASSGIDIISSDNVVLEGNRIEGHVIGIQIDGTGHKLTANLVRANRIGVMQMAGGTKLNTLSENRVYDNGKDVAGQGDTPPINLSLNGLSPGKPNDAGPACSDGVPDCSAPQNTPVLVGSTWDGTGFTVRGTLSSRASATFSLEIFASHGNGIDGRGEGEVFLGRIPVTTSAEGLASFTFAAGANPLKDGTRDVYFTATATRTSNGQSSEFSLPQLVKLP